VDQYAAEFTKLSRFAPYMVAQEGDCAKRFLHGLDINIQSHIVILSLNTYAQVLETVRTQKQILQQRRRLLGLSQKCPMTQIPGSQYQAPTTQEACPGSRPVLAVARKELVCTFCHLPSHALKDCRQANHKFLSCRASDHQLCDCLKANNPHQEDQSHNRPQPRTTPSFTS